MYNNFARPQRDILLDGPGGSGFINHEWEAILKLDEIDVKRKILERERDAITAQINAHKLLFRAMVCCVLCCSAGVLFFGTVYTDLTWILYALVATSNAVLCYVHTNKAFKYLNDYEFLQSGGWTNDLRVRLLELERMQVTKISD